MFAVPCAKRTNPESQSQQSEHWLRKYAVRLDRASQCIKEQAGVHDSTYIYCFDLARPTLLLPKS